MGKTPVWNSCNANLLYFCCKDKFITKLIMERHSSLLILLFLLLFTTSGTAQPYILQHLSIEDGLSNNYVQDIAQDKRGCIWIATVLGLNRLTDLSSPLTKVLIPNWE